MRFVNSFRRKLVFVWSICAIVCILIDQSGSAAQRTGRILGWGSQVVGVDVDGGFTAVAAGGDHSLGLKKDGSVVAATTLIGGGRLPLAVDQTQERAGLPGLATAPAADANNLVVLRPIAESIVRGMYGYKTAPFPDEF